MVTFGEWPGSAPRPPLALDCCPLTAPGMAPAVHQCFSHPGVIFRVFSRPVLWFLSKPRTHASIQTLLFLDPLQPISLCSCYTHLLPRAAWTCVKARSPLRGAAPSALSTHPGEGLLLNPAASSWSSRYTPVCSVPQRTPCSSLPRLPGQQPFEILHFPPRSSFSVSFAGSFSFL